MVVIFDMDGVLIDTVRLHLQAYNEILDEWHGVRVSDDDYGELIGMSIAEQVPLLNKKFSITIDQEKFVTEANVLKRKL